MEAVGNLLSRDQHLAERLRNPDTTSRQIFREECMTSEMAETLIERFPDHVEFRLFTTHEENRNGADWYWRIQVGNRAVHARVQAKRVQRSRFGESDENGKIDIEIEQLRKLLDSAESDSASLPGLETWVATFAQLNASPPCGNKPAACKNHGCGDACADANRLPSIWIAEASDLVNDGQSHLRIDQILKHSVRLDCILPCIESGNRPGPVTKGFSLASGVPTFDTCIEAIQSSVSLKGTFEGALQIKV
jgi:hypothetical protein